MVVLFPFCSNVLSMVEFPLQRSAAHRIAPKSFVLFTVVFQCVLLLYIIIIIVHLIFKNLRMKFSGLQSNLMKHLKKLR